MQRRHRELDFHVFSVKKNKTNYFSEAKLTSYPSTLSGSAGRASQITSICTADTILVLTLLGTMLGTVEMGNWWENPRDPSTTHTLIAVGGRAVNRPVVSAKSYFPKLPFNGICDWHKGRKSAQQIQLTEYLSDSTVGWVSARIPCNLSAW